MYVPIKTRYLHTNQVTLARCWLDGDWISHFSVFPQKSQLPDAAMIHFTKFTTISVCFSIVAGAFRNMSYRTYTSLLLQESSMGCEYARRFLFYRTAVTMAPVSFNWCFLSSQPHRDTNQVSACQEFNERGGCSTGVGLSPDLAKKSDCQNCEMVSRHDQLIPWFLCFSFLSNLLIRMFR